LQDISEGGISESDGALMERWEINNRTLEYDDGTHTYLVDGIIVPSVTQLLNRKFGHKYDDVDSGVLRAAAERGTMIHKAVEGYCKSGAFGPVPEVQDFAFLQKYYKFAVEHNELPIILDIAGDTFAGRLDLILNFDGVLAVADIKTTSTLDKDYLGHQLNLYRIGAMQSYGFDIQKVFGIHLRDGKRKLVEIPIREEEWLVKSLDIHGV